MTLPGIFHALATGAATIGLNPILPPLPAEAGGFCMTSSQAFAQDAKKLSMDFKNAFAEVKKEAEARGKSVTTET